MSRREDDDSDAPEEYTTEQGAQQDQELRKVQLENKARVIREGKEKRRKRAQRLTPRPAQPDEVVEDEVEEKEKEEGRSQSHKNSGMLPKDIVKMIADKETTVFSSDSEEDRKQKPKKKKSKKYGVETVILSRMNHGPDVKSSLEFLKRRKMQVPRSSAVLKNSDQALRLLSSSGLLKPSYSDGAAFAGGQGLALMEKCSD